MSIPHYTDRHVLVHQAMVARHTTVPYRYVCVTDEPVPGVDCIPLWDKCLELGGCFNRLYTFSKDMRDILGERFICMDLDMVITGNIDHILTRPEPFVINAYRPNPNNPSAPDQYLNGGMYMMDAGAHDDVWTVFYGDTDAALQRIADARAQNLSVGSDQEWMRIYMGKGWPRFTEDDGVYEFRQVGKHLPDNACIVLFAGHRDPTNKDHAWVRKHWR
jgi:hypothetical protein